MKTIKLTGLSLLLAVLMFHFAGAQCPVPTGLGAVSLTATSSQLNWSSMTGASGYSMEIQNGQNNPNPFLINANPGSNTYTVTGLTAGFVYKFKVRTRCGGDKSSWSAWFSFVAGGGAINCVQLTGLNVTGITATGASFAWNASAGGLGYAIRIEDASGNPVDYAFNGTSTINSYTKTGLNPSSNYKVKVRKRCAAGVNSSWSAWVFFTTNALRTGEIVSGSNVKSEIMVSPNPASDLFQIAVFGNENEYMVSYGIYDMTGKMIQSKIVSGGDLTQQLSVNAEDLRNGIYQLNILTTVQNISRKIVIAK